MRTINFIGYITNDLNSVSKDIPDDIYIMKSDFTIYNARTQKLILNVPDKFLFFNIVTKNLYKIIISRKCFRNISNNKKYVYLDYIYYYDSTLYFWISTDSRKLDYRFIKVIPPNGYIYPITLDVYMADPNYPNSPILINIPFITQGTPKFTSTLNSDNSTVTISKILNNEFSNFSYDVNFNVNFDTSKFFECTFTVYDLNGEGYNSSFYRHPQNSSGIKTINILLNGTFDKLGFPYTVTLCIYTLTDFTIVGSTTTVNQYSILTI